MGHDVRIGGGDAFVSCFVVRREGNGLTDGKETHLTKVGVVLQWIDVRTKGCRVGSGQGEQEKKESKGNFSGLSWL